MLSYHNDPAVKEKLLLHYASCRAARRVTHSSIYLKWNREVHVEPQKGFTGTIVGSYAPEQFPIQLGWPEWLGRLANFIFEKLTIDKARQFGTDLLEAVPVGVDLDKLRYHLAIARIKRQLVLLRLNPEPYALECVVLLESNIVYMKQVIDGVLKEVDLNYTKLALHEAYTLTLCKIYKISLVTFSVSAALRALYSSEEANENSPYSVVYSAGWLMEIPDECDTLLKVLRAM